MKFKKITAIAASLAMTGLTIAAASAAAFPAPFVQNGAADLATSSKICVYVCTACL